MFFAATLTTLAPSISPANPAKLNSMKTAWLLLTLNREGGFVQQYLSEIEDAARCHPCFDPISVKVISEQFGKDKVWVAYDIREKRAELETAA